MKKLIMIILALTLAMGIVWVPSVAAAEPVPITIIKTIPAGGPLEAFTFEAYRDINNNGIIDGGDFLVGQTVIYGAGTGVINSTVKGPMIIHEVLIPGSAYQQLPDQIVQVSCAVEVVFNNGLGEIQPDTITTITASEIKVESGDSVDLTVTEQNTGDDPLTNPYVEVWKDGTLIATLISPPDSGDNANGILDLGETWSWTINSGAITATTTFVALGFGTDSLGNEVSYAEGYEGEWDEVRIDIECTGCLKICKYEDKNGNGQKDDGEPWLSGWVFNVTDSKGNSWSVTTDATDGSWFRADGRNCCPGCTSCETPCLYLPPGEYTITEIPKDGWTCTTDNPLTVTVECDKETKVDFGNQQECTGCLKIYKYNDKNGDGNWNHSWYYYEPYLSGWEFTVTDAAGNSWSGTTGIRGYVTICNLPIGDYTVTEIPKDGWTNTDPGDGSLTKKVTVECDKTTMVEFGNQQECTGCLKICKYEDKNGNRQRDDGEPWLSGWVFNVTDSKGNSWSVTTDAIDGSWFRADGRNCCPGCTSCETPCLYLPPGEYTITEIPKDGWTCTTDNPLTVTVGCDKETKVDFGNQQECTGCLKIYKYNDKNGDGNWNHSWYYYEPYLSGWEFTVTDAAGNSWSGTTNRRGYVKICDLVPGQYTVTEVIPLPDGWRNTDPGDGSYQKTVTVECDKTSMVKFGNQGPCFGCLNIYKY